MMVDNPFLFITPRKEDMLIGRESFMKTVKSAVLKSLDEKKIITVNGDFGIGKTFFVKKAVNELKKKKSITFFDWDFSMNTLNELRNLPTEKELKKQIVVVIDKFEFILSLSDVLQKKILEIMIDLCEARVTVIISSSDDLLKKLTGVDNKIKKYFKVLNVPGLSFEETKKLIVSRLNEVRPKKSDSLEPFSLNEIKQIHVNSKGNPRMILLLCASLFEQKF